MSAAEITMRLSVEDIAMLSMSMCFMLAALGDERGARYAGTLREDLNAGGYTDYRLQQAQEMDLRLGALLMEHAVEPSGSS